MTYDLSTIGEGQLRLTVPRGDRLLACQQLRVSPAGSEANVAGVLAQLDRSTAWASVLPRGDLSTRFLDHYRAVGVDLSHVKHTDHGRLALYFLEPGEAPLPARVTYDREHTPFRDIQPTDFNWDALLDTRLMFLTGITAALTKHTAEVVAFAISECARRGIEVALDVNFRSMLWSAEAARATLEPLLPQVSVLLCSRNDAATVFGMTRDHQDPSDYLRQTFGVAHVVSTDGMNGVTYSGLGGSATVPVQPVSTVDRPGAGDSLVAGTLHGHLNGDIVAGIHAGVRIAAHALTHFGDLTRISADEISSTHQGEILR